MPGKSTIARQLATMLIGRYAGENGFSLGDWNELLELAKENGVSQMLHTVLLKQDITPPSPIAERIRSLHLAGVIDGAKRHHQFEKILDLLTKEEITVIPVKGIWLGETVYPNIAMRGMADIDLWIRKDDVERASQVMQTIGYQENENINRPRELQEALLGEILLCKEDAPFVELHWGIFLGEWLRLTSRIDESLIWERSFPWKGKMVRQLQPEDVIIHLAVHLAVNHHMSESVLRTMIDLFMIRQNLNIDWGRVVVQAKKWRVAVPLWFVCDCMIRLFGDDGGFTAQMLKVQPSAFRRWLLRRFISPESAISGDKVIGLSKYVFLLLLSDNLQVLFRLVWQAIMPDRTWLTLRYGLKDAPVWRVVLQRILHPLLVLRHRQF